MSKTNIIAKVNLCKLEKQGFMTGKAGQKLLVIDIAGSNLFYSEKTGAVYLDLFISENDNKQYSDFNVKQSLPANVRANDKQYNIDRPFFGDAKIVTQKDNISTPIAPMDVDEIGTPDSQLPF